MPAIAGWSDRQEIKEGGSFAIGAMLFLSKYCTYMGNFSTNYDSIGSFLMRFQIYTIYICLRSL